MRNLINQIDTDDDTPAPVVRLVPRQRPLTERQFNRHVRESGVRQRTLTVKVARAMKYAPAE